MAGTTMTIRLATVLDYEAIPSADPAAQRDPARPAFLRSHREGGRCWVAESQDGVAGFLVLEYTFYGQGFVPLLVVREDARRCGVGRALLGHAMSVCTTAKLFTSMRAILSWCSSGDCASRRRLGLLGIVVLTRWPAIIRSRRGQPRRSRPEDPSAGAADPRGEG
jgi:GNAT superfamily N-acetyltransferase